MHPEPTFHQLAGVLADGVAHFDEEGRYLFVNEVIATSWAITPEDFIGRTPGEIGLPRDECAFLTEVIGRALSSEAPIELEVDLPPTQEGRSGRVERARAVVDRRGDRATVIVVLHDASDEARLDDAIGRDREELRRQREVYRALVDHAAQGIWIIDSDFITRFANRSMATLLGYDPEELLGRNALELLYDPATMPTDATGAPTMPATGVLERRVLRRRDGTPVEVERVVSTLADADGTTIGAIGLVTDLTAEHEAAARQRVVEASMRTIADLVPIGIVDANRDGTDTFHNRRAEELHGRSFEGINEHDRIDFVHPDDRDVVVKSWMDAARGEHPAPVRYRSIAEDGSIRWLEMTMVPVRDADGNVARIIETFTDADRVVATEARLEGDRDRAIEESELKSRFIARMSHELRTPLNGIIGLTSALLDEDQPPEQRELLEALRRSGDHLRDILADVLDLTELEAGRLELVMVPFDPVTKVRAVMACHEQGASGRGTSIRLETAGAPPRVLGDERRIAQIVDNLLANAVEHTDRGEIVVRVESGPGAFASTDQVQLTVSVRDTGTGIPDDAVDDLFTEFVSADDTEQMNHRGAALGLPVSRALVALMGGELDFTSTPGAGSTFWFTVPLRIADHGAPLPRPVTLDATAVADAPATVLLAEDNEVNRTVALSILQRLGLRVDVAEDGIDAVELAGRAPYAAMLMDWQMPRLDGLEATRAIRAGQGPNRSTPIVALTASAMSGDRERCLAAGMDGFLSKPFTMRELADVLVSMGVPIVEPTRREVPYLDHDRIDELIGIGGDDGPTLFDELRVVFVETAPGMLVEVRDALGRRDLELAGRVARELAGSCAAIGAARGAATSDRLAAACHDADQIRADALAVRVEEDLAHTLEVLGEAGHHF